MNKYRIFFAGTPGLELIVVGSDIASVASQYLWNGPGQIIRIELVGSTNIQDLTGAS